jgi:hypothetical protein
MKDIDFYLDDDCELVARFADPLLEPVYLGRQIAYARRQIAERIQEHADSLGVASVAGERANVGLDACEPIVDVLQGHGADHLTEAAP